MNTDHSALAESVSASFNKLQDAARVLNTVSDQLGKYINSVDESLKKLNLGITEWIKVWGWDNTNEGGSNFLTEDVGYTKHNGKWGLCLRNVSGDYAFPDNDSSDVWLFNDAPRNLRLEALDKIPDLLRKLSESAANMTARVQGRLGDVEVVANCLMQQATHQVQGSSRSELDLNHIRKTVSKLLQEQGHMTAAVLFENGKWSLAGDVIEVELSLKKKMLELTVNVEARKIVDNALLAVGSTRKLVVLPAAIEQGGVR